jgi:putative peptidoglycan lipid II flippase
MEFPTALLGVAIGTVILPSLAKHHADADQRQYSSLLDWGLRVALLFALPSAVALWLLAVPMIATLYQYGRFTPHDVFQVRTALIGYAVGLAALVLIKILAPGFFARQNLKTPVKISFFTVLVTQALALMLMWPLGHAGLTLATSLGACVNAGLLFTFLYRRRHYVPSAGWLGYASRLVVALGVLAAVLALFAGPASFWIEAGLWTRVGRLAGVLAAGAVAYFGTLWLLGFRLADFARRETDHAPTDTPAAPPDA